MKKLMMSFSILTTLILSSCGVVDGAIDKGVVGGKELIVHTREEIAILKTETLREVKVTIEDMLPKVVETIFNSDAVAFLVVTTTILSAFAFITLLILLLGAARALYKRWVN